MESIVAGVFVVALIVGYFLPSFIAALRDHHQQWAIFMLNLLLGWSLLGWVAALIWACTAVRHPRPTG